MSDTVALAMLRFSARFSNRPIVDELADVVVSLTTHGRRLRTVHLVIQSIARGTARPARILLWLSADDMASISPALKRLRVRGLEILETPDLGPHTKYYPYVSTASSLALPLVTADDDIVYPRQWLRDLLDVHHADRETVLCHRAHTIVVAGHTIAPYVQWVPCVSTNPSHAHFATGVSGVLYPARAQEVLRAGGEDFVTTCLKSDDVWINAKIVEAGIRVRQIKADGPRFPLIRSAQREALWKTNVRGESQNDEYIGRAYSTEVSRRVLADATVAAPE